MADLQAEVDKLLQRVDSEQQRPLLKRSFEACARCASDSKASMAEFQACLLRARAPVTAAEQALNREMNTLQERLQRCTLACQVRPPPPRRHREHRAPRDRSWLCGALAARLGRASPLRRSCPAPCGAAGGLNGGQGRRRGAQPLKSAPGLPRRSQGNKRRSRAGAFRFPQGRR